MTMKNKNRNQNQSNAFDGNLTEWLFRGLLGLLLFLGNNIRDEQQKQGNDLEEVKANILQLSTENAYYSRDFEAFKDILSNNVTKDELISNVNPILKQLNANTAELNARNGFMNDTEKRITKLEYQMVEILELKKN